MSANAWVSSFWRIRLWALLATLALLLMEASEISLWYQALFGLAHLAWTGIFAGLFFIIGASYLLALGMGKSGWRMLARQSVLFGWILLAIFASLKLFLYPKTPLGLLDLAGLPLQFILHADAENPSFFHILCILLVVWHAVRLARSPVTLISAQNSFQLGLVVVLLYGIIFAPFYPAVATVGLYLYLFCGLVAMSMSRIANLSETRGGRITRFGPGWLVSILAAGLGVVGLAILVGWLSSGKVMEIIATIFLVVMALLTALVMLVLSPLLVYLERLILLLFDLIQQMLDRLRSLALNQQLDKLIQQLNEGLGKIVPFVLATRGLILFGLLVLLIALALLALRLRNIRERLVEEETGELVEPGSQENFFLKLLQRLFPGASRFRRSPAQLLAAARVRQIYRLLMALSQKLGAERPAPVTPLEFLPRLEALYPGEAAGLACITGAYVKVRYGLYPETKQEVDTVEAAWEQVRQKGRHLLAAKKKSRRR